MPPHPPSKLLQKLPSETSGPNGPIAGPEPGYVRGGPPRSKDHSNVPTTGIDSPRTTTWTSTVAGTAVEEPRMHSFAKR